MWKPSYTTLLFISTIIVISDVLLAVVFDTLGQQMISFSAQEKIILSALLLTAICTFFVWYLVLRPLEKKLINERDRISEQIRLNAELRAVLDMHALVSITDTQGNITYVNNKFCEVSGFSVEELIGKDHRVINSGYHNKDFIRNMWQTLLEGNSWHGEFCNRNKSGQLYWVNSTIVPLFDKEGHEINYISILRDITESKVIESRHKQLKIALDACEEMVFFTDARGCIQYANHALCQFTGWKEAELIGKKPSLFDAPNTGTQALSTMRQKLTLGESWSGRLLYCNKVKAAKRIEGQNVPADHQEYWTNVNSTPIYDTDSKKIGYVQIHRDISAEIRHEAELKLKDLDTQSRLGASVALQQPLSIKERLKNVLTILFDIEDLGMQRKGGIFLKSANEKFLDMYLLQGKFSKEFIRREKRISLGETLYGRAAVSGKLIISNECSCDSAQGHTGDDNKLHGHYIVPVTSGTTVLGVLFLYTSPYPNQSESRKVMLAQVGDMIALAILQAKAQHALAMARDAAQHTSKTKSDFLSNVSHEIRTPMNGVLGMMEILQDTELSRSQCDLVEAAVNSADAMLTVINDILDFSKLEAGKVELENIDFNLPTLVEEVCALQAPDAHTKKLALNCFIPMDLSRWWQGDPTRIRQVLLNLLANAVKFTEQGEISVKVMTILDTKDVINLRFEIKDTGIGLTEEQQGRLFQAFTQADNSTTRRFGGTGLGLSISKNLVGLMGGAIGMESVPEQGSCFWFNLPLLQVDDKHTDPEQLELIDKRALIVENNATNRSILEHYLAHWGMTVHAVDSGSSALSALLVAKEKAEPFDVVLTDLHMPYMDGLDLARAINAIPAIAKTPRMLLSSSGLGDSAELKDIGIVYRMLKPIRQSQLYQTILDTIHTPTQVVKAPTYDVQSQEINIYPDYSGKQVLIVEDNLVNQKVVIGLLAKFQIKPDLANNGQLALEFWEHNSYDLIFMDCQMPVMDGYEATLAMRSREKSADKSPVHTPIVALTAYASIEARDTCLATGMDDYLSKPLKRIELAKVLKRWFGISITSKIEVKQNEIAINPLPQSTDIIWDEFATLSILDNDKELLNELIQIFIESIAAELAELNKALMHHNLDSLANTAHTIKGMVANFIAEPATSLAAELEQSARNNNEAKLSLLTTQLTNAVTHLSSAFQARTTQN